MGNKQTILANTVWPTNDGGSITVLEYINSSNILIRHNDNMGHVMTVNSNAVRNGCIKNPYKRSVYGIGYIGVGMHASRTPGSNKPTIEYGVWVSMLQLYKNGKNYCAQVSGRLEGVNCGTYPTVEQAREAHCRAKEIHIRRIVSQWVGKIDQRVYVNLMNWRIPE